MPFMSMKQIMNLKCIHVMQVV